MALSLNGQNLVPDPGFESANDKPRDRAEWGLLNHWDNVNLVYPSVWPYASPDFICFDGFGSVMDPYVGQANVLPYEGNGAVGLIMFKQTREYIATQLTQPLEKGMQYRVSFQVSNGTNNPGGIGINRIGVRFSPQPLRQIEHETIEIRPHFSTADIIYSFKWQEISFDYCAEEAHNYLTLGNFHPDNEVQSRLLEDNTQQPYAYYYFDEVKVEPTHESCDDFFDPADLAEFPNVLTPNGDGVNDDFRVSNTEGVTGNLTVFDRWGRVVYENADYSSGWKAENLETGVYYYVYRQRDHSEEIHGSIQLIR